MIEVPLRVIGLAWNCRSWRLPVNIGSKVAELGFGLIRHLLQ